MKLINFLKYPIIVLLILFIGCKSDSPPLPAPKTNLKVPAFNQDSAYQHIVTQLDFGFRVPGTPAHRETVDWIVAKMGGYGADVIEQDFKADFLGKKNVPCTNIMAQFNPESPVRVLLAAHFDSRMIAEKDDERQDEPIPGADDGASGVGVLIELARVITENPIAIGVDMLFFDAEDQGVSNGVGSDKTWALGAQHWSTNIVPKGYNAKYGILLDMVGSENATFGKESISMGFARELQNKIWSLAQRMGYSDFFQDFNAGTVYDDHMYVNRDAKIKMVDIINMSPKDRTSFGFYHHTHDDNIDIISKRTLQVVGQVVTAVLYNESNGKF